VQKTVLVASTPCFSRQQDWDFGVSLAAREAFADGLENDLEGTLEQFFLHCFAAAWVDESLRRLGKSSITDNLPSKNTMRTGLRLLYNNNLLAASGTCKVPTLFLGGTRDRTINPKSFEQAATMMPSASACMIRAAGHAPFISHQAQFLDIIRGYLKGDQSA
jgi:pimeloyl-[acyl-carrier protein] methyl ester esterase